MTTLRRYLLVLALGFITTSAWTLEVGDIPRPARWSIDLTGRIPPSALARFDEIADQIKANHGGELALVVVSSLDGRAPRPFATDLFNQWGLGRKDANDGTLLFLALDDRSIELLLGSGIDDSLRQAASAEIIETVIIPRLRAADLASAVVEGAEQCAERIYRLPARAATPSPSARSTSSIVGSIATQRGDRSDAATRYGEMRDVARVAHDRAAYRSDDIGKRFCTATQSV